jgi:hypothetical protein
MLDAPLSAVSDYINEISKLPVKLESIPEQKVTVKVADVTLPRVLELMSLPYGFDIRIENGAAIFFVPKR